jgi:hypothetical protein
MMSVVRAEDVLCGAIQASLMTKKSKRESDWNSSNQEFVDQLFQWCLADIGCTRMFYQENQKNSTVFQVLLGDHFIADQMHPEYAVLNLFCNRSDTEDIQKSAWISLMKTKISNARIPIYCTINEQLIFDSVTMTYECVCMPHRVCEEGEYPKTFYYIILVLFTIFLICLYFGGAYYIVILTRMYAELIVKKRDKSSNSLTITELAIKALGFSQL